MVKNLTETSGTLLDFYQNNALFMRTLTSAGNDRLFFKKCFPQQDFLNKIIDMRYDELDLLLEKEPFKYIVSSMRKLKTTVDLEKSQSLKKNKPVFSFFIPDDFSGKYLRSISDVTYVIKKIQRETDACWDDVRKNSKLLMLLRDNFVEYVVLIASVRIINALNKSSERNNPEAVIRCFASLLRLDYIKVYAFSDSEDFKSRIAKEVGVGNASEYNSIKNKVLSFADSEARRMWRAGSTLKHHQIARELEPMINEELRIKLLKAVEESYLRKRGRYKCAKVYEAMKDKIKEGGRDLSLWQIKRAIAESAKVYNMFFDPGKKSREERSKLGKN